MEWHRDSAGERYESKVRLTYDLPVVPCFDAYRIELSGGMNLLRAF